MKQEKIATDPVILNQWVQSIIDLLEHSKHSSVALCIEQPCMNLVHFFKQFSIFALYLINPVILKRYRETFNIARSKDDKKDALNLAHLIYEKQQRIKPWRAKDPNYQKLALLTEKRRQLVDSRTAISNKLIQNLKEYYPQALNLLGDDLSIPLSVAFLRKWPSLQQLQKSKLSTIKKFYYANYCRSTTAVEKRLEIIATALPLCRDEVYLEVYSATRYTIKNNHLTH